MILVFTVQFDIKFKVEVCINFHFADKVLFSNWIRVDQLVDLFSQNIYENAIQMSF